MRFTAVPSVALLALALVAGAQAQAQSASAAAGAPPTVLVLRVEGAIGPATADYVERGLQHAARVHSGLIVLQLDTPGGLDSAMRDIIKHILASPVPVAGYVAPSGARAASAGTYILYASHVAAMAPATSLGAATPVAVGALPQGAAPNAPAGTASAGEAAPAHDPMGAKRISDAAAYIRALALLRGRNAAWAERAVREAVSLPASEAQAEHVVDLVAADVPALLRALDGRGVTLAEGRSVTLATAGAVVEAYSPDWRIRLLGAIAEPSLALMLVTIGFYGLLFEFANPGYVAPGVVGAVSLLLGLYGLQTLPISIAGMALIVLGLGFFIAEAFVPSYGALGLGGVAAFALGAVMLVDSRVAGLGIPLPFVAALALTSLAFVLGVATLAARARRRPVVSGAATLLGQVGEVAEVSGNEGWAQVRGEHWRVRAACPLAPGQRVRVKRVDGLTLDVEGAES